MTEKFRPYLTAPELTIILSALKSYTPYPAGLVRYLETFAIKIERGVLTPAVSLQPTVEQKLGLTEIPTSYTEDQIKTLATNYNLFPANRAQFSPKQLELIQNYRFLNDLMSPEEEAQYVQTLPVSDRDYGM